MPGKRPTTILLMFAAISTAGVLEAASLTVELDGFEDVTLLGALNRWGADGNHRRPVDPKAKIGAPHVDFKASRASNGRWVFDDLPPGKYDLLIMTGDRLRIEGWTYVPVLEFDSFFPPDAAVDADVREIIVADVKKSPHYENKVVPLYVGGDRKTVRLLMMLIRDKPTTYRRGLGTIRHEVWQYTYKYGGWQKERRTKLLDRILLEVAELRRWTWLWDPKLGGIEVRSEPVAIEYSRPDASATKPLKGLYPY